ncbi:MAG TPA: hypothetical protein VEP46_01850 [Vicinamibacterales bacterium]|nr:hypothetical protein [Vicinamibacterales bacterium]
MNRLWRRLADIVSQALDADEREAVRGDLEESGRSGASALLDVLGLVVRRQFALWLEWRPWAALLGVVIPLGMLLSLLCRWWSEGAAIDAFVYLHNGSWTYFSFQGWRHDVARAAAQIALDCLALACWSWMAGFVIGSISRRTAWINGWLLVLVVFGEFFAVDQPHGRFNEAVFAVHVYDQVLPFALRAAFVVLPALVGTRMSRRPIAMPLWSATALALALVALTGAEIRGIQFSAILGWWQLDGRIYGAGLVQAGWEVRLLPLLLLWPALYIVAQSRSRQSPGKVI